MLLGANSWVAIPTRKVQEVSDDFARGEAPDADFTGDRCGDRGDRRPAAGGRVRAPELTIERTAETAEYAVQANWELLMT